MSTRRSRGLTQIDGDGASKGARLTALEEFPFISGIFVLDKVLLCERNVDVIFFFRISAGERVQFDVLSPRLSCKSKCGQCASSAWTSFRETSKLHKGTAWRYENKGTDRMLRGLIHGAHTQLELVSLDRSKIGVTAKPPTQLR